MFTIIIRMLTWGSCYTFGSRRPKAPKPVTEGTGPAASGQWPRLEAARAVNVADFYIDNFHAKGQHSVGLPS